MPIIRLTLLLILSLAFKNIYAQSESDESAMINNFTGIQFKSPDSSDGNYSFRHPGNRWGFLTQFELGI
jgi:hypothetical protein